MNKKIRIIIVIFIVLLAVFAIGCVEHEPALVEPTVEKPIVEKPPIFAIGDTVEIGDFRITVNSARWCDGDDVFSPEKGEDWLVIDCTIENIGNENEHISSLLIFSLIDENYFKRDMTLFAKTEGMLDGEIGIGRKMRGEIAFVVREGQSKWEFIFEPGVFGPGQAIYSIYAKEVEPTVRESTVEKPLIFAIGDTVEIGNFRMTVNSARWCDGTDFFRPEKGEDWLVIDCTIENLGNEIETVSSLLMFSLIDENYFKRDMTILVETKGRLDGDIGIGRKMRGEIAFRVIEGQTKWEFIFEPTFIGEGRAIFSIHAKEVN